MPVKNTSCTLFPACSSSQDFSWLYLNLQAHLKELLARWFARYDVLSLVWVLNTWALTLTTSPNAPQILARCKYTAVGCGNLRLVAL